MATHTARAVAPTTKRDRRLSTIFEIAKILATQQDLEAMLSELLSCLIETLKAPEAGVMLLYDPSDECLVARAAQGYDLTCLKQLCLAPGEAMCGKTFQTGEVQLCSTPKAVAEEMRDLTPTNRKIFQAAIIGRRELRSAICIPLFAGKAKVGVLRLENRRQPRGFVHEDIPFLKAVADLIALSIENARLRQELQAARALEEANRLKAEVISILAHEMRTPLTSIKGYSTALLMEEATFSPETQQEFLQIIDEECDTLQDLIHDLLESSIIDAGLLRLEPQPVMLPRLAKRVTDDIAHRSQKHRFLIDFPECFPIVDADPRRIEQVLRNLLDNAVKYSPQGGLIVVRGEVREDEIVVSVADQGMGISPEHLNRLFEKFFRVKSALGRHVVGSGLGLPIAHTIVESHGGRIWAESQLGQGSTFYFTLPLPPKACPEQGRRVGGTEGGAFPPELGGGLRGAQKEQQNE
ncbi:MAG TPA: GAF domain-containing sensor histidine kinase [Anaerolineae bacterium]|nr:GAF domain-containing sensor histidine kinase [Anaerolineae bacterium]